MFRRAVSRGCVQIGRSATCPSVYGGHQPMPGSAWRKSGQPALVPYPPLFGQKHDERTATRQAAVSLAKRRIDGPPRLIAFVVYFARTRVWATRPSVYGGHRPKPGSAGWRTAAAHRQFGTPRRSARSLARELPPGRPRSPCVSDLSIPCHVSPGASYTCPLFCLGHFPVRWKWASAQARISLGDSRGSALGFRTPRRSARSLG